MSYAESKEEQFEIAVQQRRIKWERLHDEKVNYHPPIPSVSLKQLFNQIAEQNPDKTYLYYGDKQYTYADCNSMARKIANGLAGLGCVKGDRVVTFLSNSPQFVYLVQACFKLGLILVNSNPMDSPLGMAYRMKDSQAKVVVTEGMALESVCKALLHDIPSPKYLIVWETDIEVPDISGVDTKVISKERLVHSGDEEPQVVIEMNDTLVLQYTGGTTGVFKGCCQTNRAYIARIEAVKEFFKPFGISEDNFSVIIGLPMSHAYGFAQGIISSMAFGGSIIMLDSNKFTTEELFQKIEKFKPVLWPSVPRWLKEFASDQKLHRYDISSLKAITCGSAPLPLAIIEEVEKVSGAVITEGYGLSETINTVTGNPFTLRQPGTVGIPYPNMEYLIVDKDSGETVLSAGQEGEIIVRGPMVIKEYWNNPEETYNAIRHGWFYTGDIGVMDENGYLQIKDRKKDMIIVSGFNVYPKEIEDLLISYPSIADVCCIGAPDEKKGEIPVVYVVRKDMNVTESDLVDYCRTNLARYKVPQQIYFIDTIPKTANNKPDRKVLKNNYLLHNVKSAKNDCGYIKELIIL